MATIKALIAERNRLSRVVASLPKDTDPDTFDQAVIAWEDACVAVMMAREDKRS